MSVASLPPIDSVAARDPAGGRPAPRWRILAIAAALVAAVAAWQYDADRRAIRQLPDVTRVELYQRTLADLTSLCTERHAPALGGYCREQAERVLRFAECDGACVDLARRQLWVPTR